LSRLNGLLLFFIVYIGYADLLLAQPTIDSAPSDAVILPEGFPELAIPGRESRGGTRIHSENATAFQSILSTGIKDLVLTNRIHIEAYSYLPYAWRLDDEWESLSASPPALKLINEGPHLDSDYLDFHRGLAFGDRSSLDQEIDPAVLAHKILWNTASNMWSNNLIDVHFDYAWRLGGKDTRHLTGKLSRAYPRRLVPESDTSQLFREVLKFNSPVQVKNFSWLTFRFLGSDEDAVWLYSPAIKKIRQITGTNRSDPLLSSAVSSDDFFTWSGKHELTSARVLDRSIFLAPFPDMQMIEAKKILESCIQVSPRPQPPRATMTDYRGGYISSSQINLPSGTAFIPREMYKIELTSRDPYAAYGRQLLYVDTISMLPVYKVVYNTSGEHIKTVISSWGLAITDDRQKKLPFPAFTAVLDEENNQSVIITYSRTRYCSSFPAEESLSDYEPRSLLESHIN